LSFYISESDLLLSKEYYEGMNAAEPDKLKELLFIVGMDTSKPVIQKFDTHRNLQRKAYKGIRFVGEERTDKEWLRGGYASLDAHIDSSQDKTLCRELRDMCREGFGGEVYNEMIERAAKQVVKEIID
jgi:hypothetical protein